MFTERVRVTPPADEEDPFSGEMESGGWGTPVERDVQLWPSESTVLGESVSAGRPWRTVDRLSLVFPYGTLIDYRSKIAILSGPYAGTEAEPGGEWQVDGDPAHWRSPLTGWAPGTVVNLIHVKG